jgi:hypothetical protein
VLSQAAQRRSVSQRSAPGMMDGDGSSNSRSRSICSPRLPGSSGSSFRIARSLSPISSAVLGIYVNAVEHKKSFGYEGASIDARPSRSSRACEHRLAILNGTGDRRFWLSARALVLENSGPCSRNLWLSRDMRRVVNGERRSRVSKVLTGAFVPLPLIVTPFGRKGKQLERRADTLGLSCGMDRCPFRRARPD